MEIGKPVRNWLVAQARGDGSLDEAKLVKMEKHKQIKNAFWRENYGVHSEPVLSVKDIPRLVPGPLCIHSLGHSMLALPALTHSTPGWGRSPGGRNGSLPGESHEQRSLRDYSPWVAKSRTQLKQPSTHHDLVSIH